MGSGDRSVLAGSDALRDIAGHRFRARWDVAGIEAPLPLLPVTGRTEGIPLLKQPTEGQKHRCGLPEHQADFATTPGRIVTKAFRVLPDFERRRNNGVQK